ncbi:tetratricopeptide repeat protein, partial [Streptomyces sp. FH025]|nr:tetratricopeptide repeat protein [Streptomyces sp. FH025]
MACCSLAAALVEAGRPGEARKALARAREQCPGLARIAGVDRMP